MKHINSFSGCRIYLKNGSGHLMLLVHGPGSFVSDWRAQIEYLRKLHTVFAIDLRGHGRRDKLKIPITMADFMCAMNMDSCPLIGLSTRGMVTFQLMGQHPKPVSVAVIINSMPYFSGYSLKIWLQIFSRLLLLRFFGLQLLSRMIANNLYPATQEQFQRVVHQRVATGDYGHISVSHKQKICQPTKGCSDGGHQRLWSRINQ